MLRKLFLRQNRRYNYKRLIVSSLQSHSFPSPLTSTPYVSRRRLVDSSYTHSSGDAIIRSFAAKSPTFVSLSDIITYTGSSDENLGEYGKFIWNELPIRISHRVVELSSLPYNLSNTESIRELRELYTHSFHLFRMLECPDNEERENLFIQQMKDHFNSLKSAVPLIASGLTESMISNPNQAALIQGCPFLNGFLDRFHGARIGTRLLTGQYISCKEQVMSGNKRDNILGLIDFECNPKQILETAVDDAVRICESNFGKCPDVNIKVNDNNIQFAYIPSDLHYIFFEVMKNSMRAVCEHYRDINDSDDLPSIECVIVASQQSDDVTVKISDQGGGISRDHMDKIWFYSFTTVQPDLQPSVDDANARPHSHETAASPMAGFGYGLPLSRLYARYFGGDLEVISMDGYGSDAFIYLNWLKPDDVKPLRASNVLNKADEPYRRP